MCSTTTGCYYPETNFTAAMPCFTQSCDPLVGLTNTATICRPSDQCSCDTSSGQCTCKNFLAALSTPAKIGAGVIGGITVAGAAALVLFAVGGKKGYDYYKSKGNAMGSVLSNPMYEEKPTTTNPFYVDETA